MKVATAVLAGVALAASGLGYAQEVRRDTIRAISAGRQQYVQHCAACHGMLARGNTNVPLGTDGDGQTCAPADLTAITRRDGRFDAVHVVNHVVRGDDLAGMPAATESRRAYIDLTPRSQTDVRNLVRYLEWVQVHEGAVAH